MIVMQEVYEQQKELILLAERVVLATLGFNFSVYHPYKPLVEAIKRIKVAQNSLAQVAWNFVNDGLEKQKKACGGDVTQRTYFMDDDDLIERELEDGIELPGESEKNKQDRIHNWSKPSNQVDDDIEDEQYHSNRKQKCYKCRQKGHIIKNCIMKKEEHVEGTKKPGNIGETATLGNKEIMTAKPTVSLKYPKWIQFSTKFMVKGTDQGHWDDICKLDDQMKLLFTYGVGEVVIKNGNEKYLIPGVYYAPEVTLNVL
uniref:CCHC-type domain-containing protein n=1 Tax=Tanacetum cinerariifolium TaxID=118510 RepID=A0A699KB52_TANCI|nr:hypothetical protein [Tanacetum cinerariifolium]